MYPAYPRHCFSLRGLVHICIPHTGTPCGRVIGLKVLPTLVGLSLWDCLALAFCTLIVSQLGEFVKRFFQLFFGFVYLNDRTSVMVSTTLDFSYIVPHIGRFVKREFFFLRTFLTRCTSSPFLVSLVGTSLLTMIVYHILHQIAIGKMHKIGIFIFLIFVHIFS